MLLNDLPARGYASHGESWSFALALKLASAAVLRADSPTGDPVVILDDVFAELDEGRRAQLASAVGDYEQVLITAAVFSDVPVELAGHVVQIEAGADHGRDAGGGGMTEEEEPPEHVAVFRRIRASFGDPSLRSGTRGGAGGRHATRRACRTEPVREPRGVAEVVETFTTSMGWESPLARAELLASWGDIVGPETAAHAEPVGIEEGVLTVRCDSTAWAQQLRTMRGAVITRIVERHAAPRSNPCGSSAPTPLLETRSQDDPRARSPRYLRLTRQIRSSGARNGLRRLIPPESAGPLG